MKIKLINSKKTDKPYIKLKVMRVEHNIWYDMNFYKHHYLTSNLNKSCKCLLFTWDGVPCAFVGLLNSPSKGQPYKITVSRIVILPEFQGLGLASRILNFCGGIVKACGEEYSLHIKTIHEKMGKGLERNKLWKATANNGKYRKVDTTEPSGKYKNRLQRASYCYKYIGEALNGYNELMLPISVLRKNKENHTF